MNVRLRRLGQHTLIDRNGSKPEGPLLGVRVHATDRLDWVEIRQSVLTVENNHSGR